MRGKEPAANFLYVLVSSPRWLCITPWATSCFFDKVTIYCVLYADLLS